MCWNAEVSLTTFLIGVIGIGVGIQSGLSLPVAFFCLTIVLMQLIEYFVWTFYSNPAVNYTASLAASGLLWLQPVASIFTLGETTTRNGLLLAYVALSAIGKALEDPNIDYSMTRAPNGHLAWNWMKQTPFTFAALGVYMVFLFTPIFLNRNVSLAALALLTLSLSLYSYWQSNTWGSMWCWIVNGIVLVAVGQAVHTKFAATFKGI